MSSTRLRLPRIEPTPEAVYWNRRQFLAALGYGTMAAMGPACGASSSDDSTHVALRPGIDRPEVLKQFPARRNPKYNLGQALTKQLVAGTHHNFYEFTLNKARVWKLAQHFQPDPWTIEVTGLCHKPRHFDIDDIFKLAKDSQEERTYRFRCVEAWAMDVPWTGIAFSRLLKEVEPKSDAKYVRFVTVNRPEQMPGILSQPQYPWPYFEGLRMDEAMNELTLLATGIYGRPLPRSHGAPFRMVVPWKYGYKGPKSIVKIVLVAHQPKTFWETLQPQEYPFESNVDPNVPHPRWSQAAETVIGVDVRRPTLMYNGYGEFVSHLYV